MNDSHLFKTAREASFNSTYSGCGRVHLGAVIAYKGSILAKGWNSDKTHSAQEKFNKCRYQNDENKYLPSKVHAEMMALTKIKYLDIDFSKAHIYVYRELKSGSPAMARPCKACMAAIKEMGLKHVHYTTYDGYAYEKLI